MFVRRVMNKNEGFDLESDAWSSLSSSGRAERRRILNTVAESHKINLMNRGGKMVVESDDIQESWSDEHGKIARNFENLSVYDDRKESGMRRSGLVGRRNVGICDMGSFQSDERMVLKEDSSNFFPRASDFGHANLMSRRKGWDEFDKVEYNGEDGGAEYLRFMEQSGNMNKGKEERVSLDRRRRMPDYEPYVSKNLNADDASLGMNRASMLHYASPKSQFRGLACQNQYVDPLSSVHMQETGGSRFYPPQYTASHAQNHSEDHPLVSSQTLRRNTYPNPSSARPHDPHSQTRWPSDVDSIRQRCCPIAGCAPFFICDNCFQLLLLPKKLLNQNSDRKKMRCGGCFKLVVFTISNKNLMVLIDELPVEDIPAKAENNPVLMSTHCDPCLDQARAAISPNCKKDDTGYEFQHMHGELPQLFTNGKDNSCTDSGKHNLISTYGSEAADSENLSSAIKKLLPDNAFATQISTVDLTAATEIDIPPYEYTNTGTTFVSDGRSGDHKKDGVVSFSGGSTDNIFRDSNGSKGALEPEKANVSINGNPVHDRLIRRAEKLAGPIEPGHYWYDIRAGFWGMMGGSCIGIIPPGITEFKYLMPENCSGGNTGVFVNGRELSQKDLNVLGQRGLPPDRDRSYIVEISGRVIDADTGAQLLGLGKLAPSLEKSKRGYGMKDPCTAVDF